MRDAVLRGAAHPDIDGVTVRSLAPLDAGVDDVVWADAIVLGTPENFGTVSGLMKDFLERIYHPCLDRTRGRPYALFVRAGNDGTGTVEAIERIVTGLAWRSVAAPVLGVGDELDPAVLEACAELGATVAAGLAAELF